MTAAILQSTVSAVTNQSIISAVILQPTISAITNQSTISSVINQSTIPTFIHQVSIKRHYLTGPGLMFVTGILNGAREYRRLSVMPSKANLLPMGGKGMKWRKIRWEKVVHNRGSPEWKIHRDK